MRKKQQGELTELFLGIKKKKKKKLALYVRKVALLGSLRIFIFLICSFCWKKYSKGSHTVWGFYQKPTAWELLLGHSRHDKLYPLNTFRSSIQSMVCTIARPSSCTECTQLGNSSSLRDFLFWLPGTQAWPSVQSLLMDVNLSELTKYGSRFIKSRFRISRFKILFLNLKYIQ